MIVGITHDEDGILNVVEKYRGKISAGYAPGEGPNKANHPVAAGFFRILKETTKTDKIGTKVITSKQWVLNAPMQDLLGKSAGNAPETPRIVEIISLYKTPQEMWDSCLCMFNDDGLACKSHGKGTPAKQLIYDAAGERQWAFREFDGIPGCIANKCPDYIAKKCKPHGNMKCFPSIDLAPNPYRFETTSVNTIVGIESALSKLWHLLAAAHTVKSLESGKDIPFEGFFGMKLFLVHKKIKSGGRDVFITDLLPSKEFTQIVMEPIKRGILKNVSAAKLAGGAGSVSLLSDAAQKLIQSSEVLDEFAEDADLSAPPSEEEIVDQAAEALTEK